MTLTTGGRNVYLCDRRLGIGSRQDVMAVMTISAHCSTVISLGDRFRMDTLSIRKKGTIANATSLHDRLVTMAAATGLRNVGPVNRRLGVGRREDCGKISISSVAVETGGSFRTVLDCLGVKAAIIGSMYVRVKLRSCQVR